MNQSLRERAYCFPLRARSASDVPIGFFSFEALWAEMRELIRGTSEAVVYGLLKNCNYCRGKFKIVFRCQAETKILIEAYGPMARILRRRAGGGVRGRTRSVAGSKRTTRINAMPVSINPGYSASLAWLATTAR